MTNSVTAQARASDQLGRALRDLRISVTDRCNFRCAYCMPPGNRRPVYLDRSALLSYAEITRVATAFATLGVHKIRLTGGEPLLRRGLPNLVKALNAIPGIDDLALTTNGWLLAEHAQALADAGLRRVTVSLDSLDPAIFGQMSGIGADVAQVVHGIRAARAAGLSPVKLNAVVQRGVNDDGLVALARFARDEGLVLRFIEYMDVGQSHAWRSEDVVPAEAILRAVGAVFPLEPADPSSGATATLYRYRDGCGKLGVISSVSKPFCTECTRVRITAEGRLYTCLFAEQGHDVRALLTEQVSDEELATTLAGIWAQRTDRYSMLRSDGHNRGSIEMHRLGG